MVIEFNILGWLLGFLVLVVILVLLQRKGHSIPQLLFFSIFWLYLLVVIKSTLFPIYIDAFRREVMGRQFMASVNLIPLYFGPFTNWTYALPGIILNTLLTMPAGFGISFLIHFKFKDLAWLIAVFGFGIEGMQLFISLLLGYPYRTIDINDVIFNSLGVLLGYIAFRLFAWIYTTISVRFKIRHAGLFSYIHDISSRAA